MKIGITCDSVPTEAHVVFAWLPVLVVNRTTGELYYVWLENVERKLISLQGIVQWSYSPVYKDTK